MPKQSVVLLLFGCLSLSACHPDAAEKHPDGPLRLVQRLPDGAYAYVSAAGDTVIPFGRYALCATERFDKVALVLPPGGKWVGIDRLERVLFHPFIFDNGPDYPVEGVIRIVNAAGLIGYADTATGRVVLAPQYEAAFPFEGGRARVGRRCRLVAEGEHSRWDCAAWQSIDHQGRLVPDAAR
ncbi:WG repeat-containing protein [Hymenobacter negativus]|uniref:WG repeat-containing protein n=1 Tax=Hymenobacter negativus TaxID=2795026 RepID=A0ABS3Q8S9_9BACT|nr:WG repeat-containing protein [Hymenobacter negativus]MBO2007621.1 WG repeat-containing protein [Hymenobacter negativus]